MDLIGKAEIPTALQQIFKEPYAHHARREQKLSPYSLRLEGSYWLSLHYQAPIAAIASLSPAFFDGNLRELNIWTGFAAGADIDHLNGTLLGEGLSNWIFALIRGERVTTNLYLAL